MCFSGHDNIDSFQRSDHEHHIIKNDYHNMITVASLKKRNKILDFVAKHPLRSKSNVISGVGGNRNDNLKEINLMIKNGIILVEYYENDPQTELLSLYQNPEQGDKAMETISKLSGGINYSSFFEKWNNKKLTQRDRNAIYDTAMVNILPNLDMGQIFLWYSCATHGDKMSRHSEKDLIKVRNEINHVIRLVHNLDPAVCELVKTSIKGRLMDSNHRLL